MITINGKNTKKNRTFYSRVKKRTLFIWHNMSQVKKYVTRTSLLDRTLDQLEGYAESLRRLQNEPVSKIP